MSDVEPRGRFIKRDLWLPAGWDPLTNSDREYHLAVCHFENWAMVRDNIELANPSWRIKIVAPGTNVYGMHLSGYTVSVHCRALTDREHLWLEAAVETAVVPEAADAPGGVAI